MELATTHAPRTIAIGDIHGCSAALIDAIEPGPEDTLVTLGDYINRGPDSRRVLDLLMDPSQRCRLVPLLGQPLVVSTPALEHDLEPIPGPQGERRVGHDGMVRHQLQRIPPGHQ
jgi:hypothetical protein